MAPRPETVRAVENMVDLINQVVDTRMRSVRINLADGHNLTGTLPARYVEQGSGGVALAEHTHAASAVVSGVLDVARLSSDTPADGEQLTFHAATGLAVWEAAGSGGGGGGVTSVGLTMPLGFGVTGSPVESSGTLEVAFTTATANRALVSGSGGAVGWALLDLANMATGVLSPANGGTGVNNSTRTLTVNANGGTLAFSAASLTLTIPATGSAVLGTGTADRVGVWSGTNTLATDAEFRWTSYHRLIIGSPSTENYKLCVLGATDTIAWFERNNTACDISVVNISAAGTTKYAGIRLQARNGAGTPANKTAAQFRARLTTTTSTSEVGEASIQIIDAGTERDVMQLSPSGMTLLQGGNDTEILILNSTDVAHGVTDLTATTNFGYFKKIAAAEGGFDFVGLRATGTTGFRAHGIGTADDTTKGSTAVGFVIIQGSKKSGTNIAAGAANSNILVVRSNTDAKLIVDQEGDLHVDGSTTITAFDEHHDISLVRTFERVVSGGRGIVDSQWDAFVQGNRDNLEQIGVLSSSGFINVTRLQRLQNGALWQIHEQVQELRRELTNVRKLLTA